MRSDTPTLAVAVEVFRAMTAACNVARHSKAQGAILGKPMEPLKQGEKGQILVLVTLQ
jgi:hypothetical protein